MNNNDICIIYKYFIKMRLTLFRIKKIQQAVDLAILVRYDKNIILREDLLLVSTLSQWRALNKY